MADITKCTTITCPIKHTCRRHTAPDSEFYQSVQDFQPTIIIDNEQNIAIVKCDDKLEIEARF